MIGGASPDTIAAQEGLPATRIHEILREELARRWVNPVADFAKLQIARLESLSFAAFERGRKGKLKAIDRALKILDRLDRYHGFSRANPTHEAYGEEERERLLDKLNTIAARLEPDTPEG